MNLYKKLFLFLLLQALIFLGTMSFFIYTTTYPAYLVLEKTINEDFTINSPDPDQEIEHQAFNETKENVKMLILITILIGLIFTVGALLFMHYIILKPIHTLRNQMNWIIHNKKFRKIHQYSKTKDEFADLTKHFNSLIEHVIEQNKALEDLVLIDPLTSLQNRRSLDQYIATLGALVQREEKNISVIMIDIDHFKLYNDTYGHIQGDEIIRKVSQAILNNASRLSDFVARYGGEEFVVIFVDTSIEGAKTIAQSICKEVESFNIPHKTSPTSKNLTLSIGASSELVNNKDHLLRLIEKADDALYNAKSNGRNQVFTHIHTKDGSK